MNSTVLAQTVGLLALSNVFMTFAWYAHLKELSSKPWLIAALASWAWRCSSTCSGSRESHRLQPIQPRATEDHPGSDHAPRVRPVRAVLHEPASQARLS